MTVGTAGFASRVHLQTPDHWWRLHDISSSMTTDSVKANSASSTRGTVGTPTFRVAGPLHTSQITYGITYNGTTDASHVTGTNKITALNSGTFFCFYKRTASGSAGVIISGRTVGTTDITKIEVLATGAPKLTIQTSTGNALTLTATGGFTADTSWHFLCITSDGVATPIMYIDGAAVAATQVLTGTAAASWWLNKNTSANISIGSDHDTAEISWWAGSLSEVGHLTQTLSAAGVTDLVTGQNFILVAATACFRDLMIEKFQRFLAADMPFDEASGNFVNIGNHGDRGNLIASTGATPMVYQGAGKTMDANGFAISLAGNASIANGPYIANSDANQTRYWTYNGTTRGAYFFVVKMNSVQPGSGFYALSGIGAVSSTNGLLVQVDTLGLIRVLLGKPAAGNWRRRKGATGLPNILDNLWHFVAVVQRADGTDIHIFVDGVEASSYVNETTGTPPATDDWGNVINYAGVSSLIGGGADQAQCKMFLDYFGVLNDAIQGGTAQGIAITATDILELNASLANLTSTAGAGPPVLSTATRRARRRIYSY